MDEPKVWHYTVPGAICAGAVYLFSMNALSFPKDVILALSCGFFASSITFSTLSLLASGKSMGKASAMFFGSLVLGAIPFALLWQTNMVKAVELFLIVSGIASLVIGYYLEKK